MNIPPPSPAPSAAQATPAGTPAKAPASPEAARAAFEFEVLFLSQAVEEMMRGTTAGQFGGGHAEDTWRSFLARAYAEQIAGQGGTGIARSIEAGIAAYGSHRTTE